MKPSDFRDTDAPLGYPEAHEPSAVSGWVVLYVLLVVAGVLAVLLARCGA